MTDQTAFEYRDYYGDRLTARPTGIAQAAGLPPLPVVGIQVESGATLYVPVDRVEEVVAGIRDAALQAAGQPAADECTPCSFPPCVDGEEFCSRHEREVSHAEGCHELCGAECPAAGLASDGETAQCWRADPHPPHTWTWRPEEGGVDCPGLRLGTRTVPVVETPAAGLAAPTNHNTETEARERIENLWDRATPVGPLLDAYRAAILNSASDDLFALDPAEAALAGQHAWVDAANLLRRLAAGAES